MECQKESPRKPKPRQRARNRQRAENHQQEIVQSLVNVVGDLQVVTDEPGTSQADAAIDVVGTAEEATEQEQEHEHVTAEPTAASLETQEIEPATNALDIAPETGIESSCAPGSDQELSEETPQPKIRPSVESTPGVRPESVEMSKEEIDRKLETLPDIPPPVPVHYPNLPAADMKHLDITLAASSREAETSIVLSKPGSETAAAEIPTAVDSKPEKHRRKTSSERELVAQKIPPPAAAPALVTEQTDSNNTASLRPEALYPPIVATAPPVLEDSGNRTQILSGQPRLLSEEQLRTYYLNERLEMVDDVIDGFVANEMSPITTDPFYDLVHRYCELEKQLETQNARLGEMQQRCKQMQTGLWKVTQETVDAAGTCGDNRKASGSATYTTAQYNDSAVKPLKRALKEWRDVSLSERAVVAAQCQSVEIQCAWQVEMASQQFGAENQLGPIGTDAQHHLLLNAPPSIRDQPSRTRLRYCLSVLFEHLRLPALPKRFVDDVKKWIVHFGTTLLRACTEFDQLFVLCHLLRCGLPVADWCVGLLQPITDEPSSSSDQSAWRRAQIDHFVVLLNILLTPVSKREEFLKKCITAQDSDVAWTMLDSDGEDVHSHWYAITDCDLVALFGQFAFHKLFIDVLALWTQGDLTQSNMFRLFAFQLTLMKVLYDGMQAYNRPQYAQFCKQIAHVLRHSVRYTSDVWQHVCETAHSHVRNELQAEYDRLLLFAVHCIITSQELGIWQFLVDLPCAHASAACRDRIMVLLRSPATYRFGVLCTMSGDELRQHLNDHVTLAHRLDELTDHNTDGVYLLTALCNVAVLSGDVQTARETLRQLFEVCFLASSTRELYAKTGSECVASMIQRYPDILGEVIRLINRNVDHLQDYIKSPLSLSCLALCQPTSNDLQSLGKWLVNQPANHDLNKLARSILSSLNWGPTSDDPQQLWLNDELHCTAAQIIQSAHRQHCADQNGMIAAGVKKASKMLSRIPDAVQQFDGFCWEMLLKLKLDTIGAADGSSNASQPPADDTTVYYVHLMKHHLSSIECTPEPSETLRLLSGLVDAGCFAPAIVVVGKIVIRNAAKIDVWLKGDRNLAKIIDTCAHADQSTLSSLTGGYLADWSTQDERYLNILQSVIALHLRECVHGRQVFGHLESVLRAWTLLLCNGRNSDWNTDKCTLRLLDRVCQGVMLHAPSAVGVIKSVIVTAYQNLLDVSRNAGRGVLGWIAGTEPIAPPLIRSEMMLDAPWFTFVALLIEQEQFSELNRKLEQVMLKHQSMSLEQALKKSVTKLAMSFAIERLPYYRWMDFVSALTSTHPMLPIACQQLCGQLLRRVNAQHEDTPKCLGQRMLRCRASEAKLQLVKSAIDKAKQQWATRTDEDTLRLAEFYDAVLAWLSNTRLYEPNGRSRGNRVPLDYLLDLLISGDSEPWMNYVCLDAVRERHNKLIRSYQSLCHLTPPTLPSSNQRTISPMRSSQSSFDPNLTTLHNLRVRLNLTNEQTARQIQTCGVSTWQCPYPVPTIDMQHLSDADKLVTIVAPRIDVMLKVAKRFVSVRDHVNLLDSQLIELTPSLYHKVPMQVSVTIKCSPVLQNCHHPTVVKKSVEAHQYSAHGENKIGENRNRRQQELLNFETGLLKDAPMQMAYLEDLCRRMVWMPDVVAQQPCTAEAGITLFYHLVACIDDVSQMFPLTKTVFREFMDLIGQRYLVNVAACQPQLLDIIIDRTDISSLLLSNFTPNCLPPPTFISVYSKMLSALTNDHMDAPMALALFSKINLDIVFTSFPNEDVLVLLPMTLRLCAAACHADMQQLQQLSVEQFTHGSLARYPTFLVDSVRLMFEGFASDKKLSPELLRSLNTCLSDASTPANHIPAYPLHADLAKQLLDAVAPVFAGSRAKRGSKLLAHWSPYIADVCSFCSMMFHKCLKQADTQQSSVMQMENDAQHYFHQLVALFGPWLEPPGTVTLPWTPDDLKSAEMLVGAFVKCLSPLHGVYDKVLLAGTENLLSLFWRYYSDRYTQLRRAATHVHKLYNERFLQLPWTQFWPNLPAIDLLRKALSEGARDCRPFVCNITVRINWAQLCQLASAHQPREALRQFYTILLEILVRCADDPKYYVDCKASLPQLIDQMRSRDWFVLDLTSLDSIMQFVGECYAIECLHCSAASDDTNNNTHQPAAAALRLLRTASQLQRPLSEAARVQISDTHAKQAVYANGFIRLLLRALETDGEGKLTTYIKLYTQLICQFDDLFGEIAPSKTACGVTRCLLQFWTDFSNKELIDAALRDFCNWILDHPDRTVLLLFLHDAAVSQAPAELFVGLKIVETCITAYFQSSRRQVTWSECTEYLHLPCGYDQLMRIDSEIAGPFLLTLHAAFAQSDVTQMSIEQLLNFNDNVIRFVSGLKPNVVHEEAALLLIVGDALHVFVQIMRKCTTEEIRRRAVYDAITACLFHFVEVKQPGSLLNVIGFGKKPLFSARFRVICHVTRLFLVQQSVTGSGPSCVVRQAPDAPVLNARIQAAEETRTNKQFSAFSESVGKMLPYFKDVSFHVEHVTQLYGQLVRSLYIERYLIALQQ